jgi:FAD/FMN-containing dehydrogenase
MTREHNWADNYTFKAARIHRPASVEEARRVIARSLRIRAIGARHSFNGISDSPGDLIDLGSIDPAFLIDPEQRTVTVGAATSYGEPIKSTSPRSVPRGLALTSRSAPCASSTASPSGAPRWLIAPLTRASGGNYR